MFDRNALAKLISRLEAGAFSFDARTVLVLDEAGMVLDPEAGIDPAQAVVVHQVLPGDPFHRPPAELWWLRAVTDLVAGPPPGRSREVRASRALVTGDLAGGLVARGPIGRGDLAVQPGGDPPVHQPQGAADHQQRAHDQQCLVPSTLMGQNRE